MVPAGADLDDMIRRPTPEEFEQQRRERAVAAKAPEPQTPESTPPETEAPAASAALGSRFGV